MERKNKMNKLMVMFFGILLLSTCLISASENKIWFGRNESNPNQMIPVLLTNTGILRTDMNFSVADIWNTNLGQLTDANDTQMENNGGTLNIKESWFTSFWDVIFGTKTTDDLTEGSTNLYDNQTWNETLGDDLYINQLGDTITQKQFQLNFTFSNQSLPFAENFNNFLVKNINFSSTGLISLQNDLNETVGFFASGSNFSTELGLNNSLGVFASETDLLLTTNTPGKNIIMRVINSSGIPINTLIVESDGNVILQNDLILNFSTLFLDSVGDRFIKTNSQGIPFNGIAKNATWSGHNEVRSEGEIAFLKTIENDTISWTTILRNNSYSLLSGNSAGLVPSYMAEENFTEIDGTINMTKASNYLFICNFFGQDCRFSADTRGNVVDNLSGGPLFFTMGDAEIWQTLVVHRDSLLIGDFDVILNGEEATFTNGTIRNTIPKTKEFGFAAGDNVTAFSAQFTGVTLFPFIQTSGGGATDWTAVSDDSCHDADCGHALGSGGSPLRVMQSNFSTINITDMNISFWITKNNVGAVDTFTVEVNNNVASGDVTLFTSSGTFTDEQQTAALPASMEDQPVVSVIFSYAANSPIGDEIFIDDVFINGNASTSTLNNQSVQDGKLEFGDGKCFIEQQVIDSGDVQEMNISCDTINLIGNVTQTIVTEIELNVTDNVTANNFIAREGFVFETTGNITGLDFLFANRINWTNQMLNETQFSFSSLIATIKESWLTTFIQSMLNIQVMNNESFLTTFNSTYNTFIINTSSSSCNPGFYIAGISVDGIKVCMEDTTQNDSYRLLTNNTFTSNVNITENLNVNGNITTTDFTFNSRGAVAVTSCLCRTWCTNDTNVFFNSSAC